MSFTPVPLKILTPEQQNPLVAALSSGLKNYKDIQNIQKQKIINKLLPKMLQAEIYKDKAPTMLDYLQHIVLNPDQQAQSFVAGHPINNSGQSGNIQMGGNNSSGNTLNPQNTQNAMTQHAIAQASGLSTSPQPYYDQLTQGQQFLQKILPQLLNGASDYGGPMGFIENKLGTSGASTYEGLRNTGQQELQALGLSPNYLSRGMTGDEYKKKLLQVGKLVKQQMEIDRQHALAAPTGQLANVTNQQLTQPQDFSTGAPKNNSFKNLSADRKKQIDSIFEKARKDPRWENASLSERRKIFDSYRKGIVGG